jgi:quinol monooxygenase YgiN
MRLDIRKLEEDMECIAEKVHDSREEEKMSQGFHAPLDCESDNRISYLNSNWEHQARFDDQFNAKFYKWCDKCHPDMYPYSQLPENIKEYDRVTVRTVLNAIKEM